VVDSETATPIYVIYLSWWVNLREKDHLEETDGDRGINKHGLSRNTMVGADWIDLA
jgi:hypothetical protein